MADYTIKQNDTWSPLVGVLSDAAGPVNLTAATGVTMYLRHVETEELVSCACTKDPDQSGFPGKFSYTFLAVDTDTVGVYSVEVEVNWGSGKIQTFPNTGYKTLEIVDDLGP